jgi:hypothetical protein
MCHPNRPATPIKGAPLHPLHTVAFTGISLSNGGWVQVDGLGPTRRSNPTRLAAFRRLQFLIGVRVASVVLKLEWPIHCFWRSVVHAGKAGSDADREDLGDSTSKRIQEIAVH